MGHATSQDVKVAGKAEQAAQLLIKEAGELSIGREVKLILTMDGTKVATLSYVGGQQADRLRPLSETIQAFVESGGNVWLVRDPDNQLGAGQNALVTGSVDGDQEVAFLPSWFGAQVATSIN